MGASTQQVVGVKRCSEQRLWSGHVEGSDLEPQAQTVVCVKAASSLGLLMENETSSPTLASWTLICLGQDYLLGGWFVKRKKEDECWRR